MAKSENGQKPSWYCYTWKFLPNSLGLAVPLDLEPGSKSYSYPLQLAAEYQLDVLIETPEEACGSLLILGWLALQMKPQLSTGTFAESTPSAVLKRLQNWKHLILQRGQSQARRDTIAILDIWSEVLLIKSLTDGRLWECEMRYDDYSSHFLRTIQQGKRFMAQRSLQDSWVRSGVVAPLFFCAFKCRDWVIRREALHLLSGCGSEQGIWSISKPSLVLDRLIKIETRDCQSWETIPESARIDAVRVEFLSGETKVRFWYRHPVRFDGEGQPRSPVYGVAFGGSTTEPFIHYSGQPGNVHDCFASISWRPFFRAPIYARVLDSTLRISL